MFSFIRNQKNISYLNLVDAIKQKINNGQLLAGEKLPTLAVFSEQTGLANYSVRKAISMLVDQGVLETAQGGGVYVSRGLADLRIALADAFRFNDSFPQLRHPITISGIYSQANESGVIVDLLRPDTDFNNPEAIRSQIRAGRFDGLIWLYPEEDRMRCIEQINSDTPVVLTSHSRTEFNLPAVESDESWNAVRVGKHFLSCNVPKVVQLVEPWIIRTGGVHSGGHIMGINSLKMTFMEAGFTNYELVGVRHTEIQYRETFLEVIESLEDNSGLFLANTDCFKAVMEADFEKLVKHLSRLNVVIATTDVDNNSLLPLAECVDFLTCVNPLSKIGSISLQKIINVLNGLNEDTATIVRISFGKFRELAVNESLVEAYAV